MPSIDELADIEREPNDIRLEDDGELAEDDLNVDPAKYQEYAANFRLIPRQNLNTWDDSRIMMVGFVGVFIVLALIIAAVTGMGVILLIVILVLIGLFFHFATNEDPPF